MTKSETKREMRGGEDYNGIEEKTWLGVIEQGKREIDREQRLSKRKRDKEEREVKERERKRERERDMQCNRMELKRGRSDWSGIHGNNEEERRRESSEMADSEGMLVMTRRRCCSLMRRFMRSLKTHKRW